MKKWHLGYLQTWKYKMAMIKNRRAEFQPYRLTQGRHHRLLNMAELAERVGLTRQAISSYERGNSKPSPEMLREIARELEVTEAFLTSPIRSMESARASIISFRTLMSSTLKARNQANAYLDLLSSLISFAIEYVEIPNARLPALEIQDYASLSEDDIEGFAQQTRRYFGLGDGPISDLTLLLENHGVIIGYVPLASKMDGISAWYADRPFILVNRKFSAVRRRFDLAHELGHLVLHKMVAEEDRESKEVLKKMEHDAHRFASAFLMPEAAFAKEVYGTDIDSLADLKLRWLASIGAMIVRLADLKIIGEHQKTRLFQRLSASGMRKNEKYDDTIPVEKARLPRKIFEFLSENQALRYQDILGTTSLPQFFIEWITELSAEELAPRMAENVISIRRIA